MISWLASTWKLTWSRRQVIEQERYPPLNLYRGKPLSFLLNGQRNFIDFCVWKSNLRTDAEVNARKSVVLSNLYTFKFLCFALSNQAFKKRAPTSHNPRSTRKHSFIAHCELFSTKKKLRASDRLKTNTFSRVQSCNTGAKTSANYK